MLKQVRHKRFIKTMVNDMPLSPRCYGYPQATGSIALPGTGNENDNDSDHQRPDHVHMQE